MKVIWSRLGKHDMVDIKISHSLKAFTLLNNTESVLCTVYLAFLSFNSFDQILSLTPKRLFNCLKFQFAISAVFLACSRVVNSSVMQSSERFLQFHLNSHQSVSCSDISSLNSVWPTMAQHVF